MSDYIKYMYREYLEGRTRIKKVNEDQPLFPNTGAGLLIQKNKLTDDWTALNVSDGHYEEESFNHEALAAAFLQGANMGQLRMLNEILDRARLNGPYCLENVADALLSFAPACKAESLMENPMLHFIELSKSFSKNGGIYDPVHGIYIDSKVNGMGDVPHFTLYDVSGESFDSYLMMASEVCKKTLGILEPEAPQPAKTKNLSQKTMSSREASTRLSDEIGAKSCTRDEGTVGE